MPCTLSREGTWLTRTDPDRGHSILGSWSKVELYCNGLWAPQLGASSIKPFSRLMLRSWLTVLVGLEKIIIFYIKFDWQCDDSAWLMWPQPGSALCFCLTNQVLVKVFLALYFVAVADLSCPSRSGVRVHSNLFQAPKCWKVSQNRVEDVQYSATNVTKRDLFVSCWFLERQLWSNSPSSESFIEAKKRFIFPSRFWSLINPKQRL